MFNTFSEVSFAANYPVHKAARDGDVQIVNSILETNPQLIPFEDAFKNWTPIHWAAYCGKLDCLRQIVSIEPSVINMQSSKTFQTAMHCSAEAGHPHCLLWLLQAGANPEVKDISGETALHKAARNGNAECVSLLLTSLCNISCMNSEGQTPSIVAELSGHHAIAEFIRNRFGSNPLQSSPTDSGIVPRFSRKRTHDMMNSNSFKRIRTDDLNVNYMPMSNTLNYLSCPKTTSVVEHERLCRIESGYRNSLLDSMFSEYHGC